MAAVLPKLRTRVKPSKGLEYSNHLVEECGHTYRVCLSAQDRVLIIALKTPRGNERALLTHTAKAKRLVQLALNAKYAAQAAG